MELVEQITNYDIQIIEWLQTFMRSSVVTTFWRFISLFGEHGLFWIGVAVVLLLFRAWRRVGFACLLSMGIGYLLTNVVLKNLVARPRPYAVFPQVESFLGELSEYSFPSGHATVSFATAFVLVRFLPKKWGTLAFLLAILVALSRPLLGVHYPSDILGGFVVGFLSSRIACAICKI